MSEIHQSNIRKGFIWTSVSQFSGVIAQFISLTVIARYLSVDDFALMGIILFFISISTILVDSGMGGSLIGKKEVTPIDFSTLFLYNIIVSVSIYVILFLLSGIIEDYYKIPGLAFLIRIANLTIIISALGIVQNVVLYRELKFKERAIIDICASAISISVAICLAIGGFGAWALIFQTLSRVFCVTVLQLFFNRRLFGLRFSVKSFKEQWIFGSHLMFSNILSTVYNNAFNMIFPKISSLEFSGLFVQANRFKQLPVSIFTSIVDKATFPILSKMDDQDKFLAINRSVARKTYLITFGVFLYISLMATPLISILFGAKWEQAGSILTIISFAGIGLVIMSVNRNTLKSLAFTKKISSLEIIKSLVGLGCLLLFTLLGDYAILWGIVVTAFISMIISISIINVNTNYKTEMQLSDILNIIKIYVVPFVVIYFAMLSFAELDIWIQLSLGTIGYATLSFISALFFKNSDILILAKVMKQKVFNIS